MHTTIENMNVLYDIPFLFFDSKTNLLTSNYQRGTSNLHTFRSFFNTNTEFILLEYIFLNGPVSFRQITDDLYISDSTLNRYISHLRMNLKSYGLSISGTDLFIDGDELAVRNFFLHYFMEKNDSKIFDNFPYFQETCFTIFTDLINRDMFTEFKPLFNYFQWKTFVSFVRISKGAMIDITEDIPKAIIENTECVFTESIKYDLIRIFNLKDFNREIFKDYIFFLFPSNHMPDDFIENSLKNIRCAYDSFLKEFDIKLSEELIQKNLNIFFQFYIGYQERRFFLFNTEEYRFMLMSDNYPKSIKSLFDIIEKTLNGLEVYSLSAVYHFILQTINYTPNVLEAFMAYEEKINIKLFLVTEPSKIEYVERLLSLRFQNVANFETIDSNTLLKEEDLTGDLWITNIENVIDKHILHITVELIHTEITMIEEFIHSYINKSLSTLT